jgi:hypothetical protein
MVKEPGTNLWVHRSESDGMWNRVDHPQNFPADVNEAIGLKNPRPARTEPNPVYYIRPDGTFSIHIDDAEITEQFNFDATQEESYDPVSSSPVRARSMTVETSGDYEVLGSGFSFIGERNASFAYFLEGSFETTKANTTFVNSLHHSDSNFWTGCFSFKTPSGTPKTGSLFSTGTPEGIEIEVSSTGAFILRVNQGGSTDTLTASTGLSSDTEYFCAVAYDTSAQEAKFLVNTYSFEATQGITLTSSDASATDGYSFGSLETGTRLYHSSFYDKVLEDSEVSVVKRYVEERHKRRYT